jgi:hypothetical protein
LLDSFSEYGLLTEGFEYSIPDSIEPITTMSLVKDPHILALKPVPQIGLRITNEVSPVLR